MSIMNSLKECYSGVSHTKNTFGRTEFSVRSRLIQLKSADGGDQPVMFDGAT